MKKSTLLSFATAAAIVVTSAGTYAAWDKTIADSGVMTLSALKQVTVNKSATATTEVAFAHATRTLLETPKATAKVSFDVKDEEMLGDTLSLKVKVVDGATADADIETAADLSGKFSIKIKKTDAAGDKVGTDVTGPWEDSSLANAVGKISSNTYYIELAPTDAIANVTDTTGKEGADATAGASIIEKDLKVVVTATYTKK